MKKCPHCAEEIKDEAIKCKHCKEMLPVNEERKEVSELSSSKGQFKSGKRKTTWLPFALLGIIVGLLVLASILSEAPSEKPKSSHVMDKNVSKESIQGSVQETFKSLHNKGIFSYKEVRKTHYKDGSVETEASYVNDMLDGVFKRYHKDGTLWEELDYKNNKLLDKSGNLFNDGYNRYYKNGRLNVVLNYQEGVLHGEWKAFHENGAFRAEGNYLNGKMEGLNKQYYESGNLKLEVSLVNDKREGVLKQYYPNGNIEFIEHFENGMREGVSEKFYDSGKLWHEKTWKNGREDGILKIYYESGELEGETTYADGKENGVFIAYSENGKIKGKVTYKDGKKDGISKLYNKDGKLESIITFENDVVKSAREISLKPLTSEGRDLFNEANQIVDKDLALTRFVSIVEGYPESKYAEKAQVRVIEYWINRNRVTAMSEIDKYLYMFPNGEQVTKVEKYSENKDEQDGRVQNMKKCPYCAEEIKDETIKCNHCDSSLGDMKMGEGEGDVSSKKETEQVVEKGKKELNAAVVLQILIFVLVVISIFSIFLPLIKVQAPIVGEKSISVFGVIIDSLGSTEEKTEDKRNKNSEKFGIDDIKEMTKEFNDVAIFKEKPIYKFIPVGLVFGALAHLLLLFLLLSLFLKKDLFGLITAILTCISGIFFLISIILSNDMLHYSMKKSIGSLEDNPFAGLAMAFSQGMKIESGVAVYIIIGATFLLSIFRWLKKNYC